MTKVSIVAERLLTAERLREVLRYDPEAGIFTWLVKRNGRDGGVCHGDIAGGNNGNGYRVIGIAGRLYLAHRLAWFYVTGEWPKAEVDHINGVRADNRWANLRNATDAQNSANMRRPATNTSGFKGVHWLKRARKWQASISVNNKTNHLGLFDADKPHLAYAAVCIASRKYYGEFARLYDDDVMIITEERILRNLLNATQPSYEVAA